MRVELSAEKFERKKVQNWVELSIKSLKCDRDWKVIVEHLIQALKDENKYIRWGAAGALGELGDAKAVQPLIEALGDKDCNVRGRAAWALGKIRDKTAVEPLTKVLKEDKSGYVRAEAKRALENISGKPGNDA